jgi:hypothetical protein
MTTRTIPVDDDARAKIDAAMRNDPRKLQDLLAKITAEQIGQESDADPDGATMLDLGEWAHITPAPAAYWLLEDIRSPFMVPGAAPTFGDCCRAVYIMAGGKVAAKAAAKLRRAIDALEAVPPSSPSADRLALAVAVARAEFDELARPAYLGLMGARSLDDAAEIIEGLLNAGVKPLERVPSDGQQPTEKKSASSMPNGWLVCWQWLLRLCHPLRRRMHCGASRSSPTATYTSDGSRCVASAWRRRP